MTNEPNWLVLYVKPRNEKAVAERLTSRGYNAWCPTVRTLRLWKDRKKKVDEPLFRSYVFIKISEKDRMGVFECPGVVRYVFWLQKPAVIREDEIKAIQQFIKAIPEENENLQIDFTPLEEVDIIDGMFANQKGKYLFKQKGQVTLLIESLGTVVRAQIPAAAIRKTTAQNLENTSKKTKKIEMHI
jgi:transcription antitermination factor NusG